MNKHDKETIYLFKMKRVHHDKGTTSTTSNPERERGGRGFDIK